MSIYFKVLCLTGVIAASASGCSLLQRHGDAANASDSDSVPPQLSSDPISASEDKKQALAAPPAADNDTAVARLTAELAQTKASLAQRDQEANHLKMQVDHLNQRIQMMESKVDSMEVTKEEARKMKTIPAATHPSDGIGIAVTSEPGSKDPASGFVADGAVALYRQALIDLRSSRYDEAATEFTQFRHKYPDHALAGAAQFNLGESYFRKKDYGHALLEYQRVLTGYDRSAHVTDALRQLARVEDLLQKPNESSKYRQLLLSNFPQSPAAALAEQDEMAQVSQSPNSRPEMQTEPAAGKPSLPPLKPLIESPSNPQAPAAETAHPDARLESEKPVGRLATEFDQAPEPADGSVSSASDEGHELLPQQTDSVKHTAAHAAADADGATDEDAPVHASMTTPLIAPSEVDAPPPSRAVSSKKGTELP